MSRFAVLLVTALGTSVFAASQAPSNASSPQTATQSAGAPRGVTLTTGTQLVVVDVTVLDRDGHPVHGLKASDFMVEESRKAQVIRNFEEHSAADPIKSTMPRMPTLPPGTFTDYLAAPEDSTLNVLLLDALNTPMTDQSYVRNQLQQYVKHANPGTRIAIFGLSQRLTMLQGFSSDPEILKAAVEHKLLPRASTLLDDPVGNGSTPSNLSDTLSQFSDNSSSGQMGVPSEVIANLQQFEAQNASFQSQLRATYTIEAFRSIGRYLSQFPGRKNLIWFSGSFPLSIFADPDIQDPFAVQADNSEELREVANLLSRARVAVFPVDARGLQTNPVFDASRPGTGYARNPATLSSDIGKFNQATAAEHMTMDQIADDTGGHAFYNTNDLASAVTKSITAGANYYTVTYSPSERKQDGSYRNIKVRLQGEAVARGMKLSFRHGYFADDASKRAKSANAAIASTATPGAPPTPGPAAPTGPGAYKDSSMQRGAPTLSEILFKVRVLPASNGVEDTVVPGNTPNPKNLMKGPFKRYMIDFAALGGDFKLEVTTDGRHKGEVEFLTYVYDSEGKLLNASGETMQLNLEPQTYARIVKTGLGFHGEVSVPAKGESFLRIGIHDLRSGHVGVVEVPVSSVARLAPPPAPAAASPAGLPK